MKKRSIAGVALAAIVSLLLAACAGTSTQESAEDYPSKPIKWYITFDPGGGSDTDFRRLQPHLEKSLGVPINVEYLTGGDGAIGWAELANSKPDGYTLGTNVLPYTILQPLVMDESGYQTEDLASISMNARAPQILFVDADNPGFKSFEEFEAAAKKDPGAIDLGGTAEFNASHVVWAQFKDRGLQTNYVASGGGATEVVAGILGGHLPIALTSAQQAVGNEQIRALAVFADEEYPLLPGVPTAKSLGYDIVNESNWGVVAPAGTPLEKREVIWKAIEEALKQPDVIENMKMEGQQPIGLGPEEADAYIKGVTEEMTEMVPKLKGDTQ